MQVQAKRGAAQPAYTTHQPMVCELSAIQESSREYSIFGQLHSPAQDTSAKKPRSGDGSDVNGSMYISDSSSSSQNDSASRQVPPLVSNVPAPNPISGDSLLTFVSRCERQINSCSLHAAKAVCARREEPRAAAVVAEDATELPVAKAAPEPCTVLFDPFKVESAVKNQVIEITIIMMLSLLICTSSNRLFSGSCYFPSSSSTGLYTTVATSVLRPRYCAIDKAFPAGHPYLPLGAPLTWKRR